MKLNTQNKFYTMQIPLKTFHKMALVLCIFLLFAYMGVASVEDNFFSFSEYSGKDTSISIHPDRVSTYTVSARLFGKFTENLGANIYGGFWAQILMNPSLEPASTCKSGRRYNAFQRSALKTLTHEDAPTSDIEDTLAFWWFPWNGVGANYSLAHDAFNTLRSQVIEITSYPEKVSGVGIRQPVFLPLHRQKNYSFSCYVKEATSPIIVQVLDPGNESKPLGSSRFEPVEQGEWKKITGTLTVNADNYKRCSAVWFCIGLAGKGRLQIDQVLLFPEDNIEGFDPEVVNLAKKSNIRILRFPGGNYASGYHWKDDLVPFDERRTLPNPAWNQCDPHHVGTDEHIAFCRLIGAEPMICVNAGDGTAEEAADWVEYCNGAPDTKWGKVRAERGHPEPYNVKIWEVGNELWGHWQIGHCTPQEYAERYRRFYSAMKKADPSIHIIANGHNGTMIPDWNEVLMQECPDILHSLSLHFLCSNIPQSPPEFAFLSQMGYSYLFEDLFYRINDRASSHGLNLKLAVTEHMIFNGQGYHPRPETLAEALSYAGMLNSIIRTRGLVEVYTHSALVNHGGGMKKDRGVVFAEPVYYARQELQRLAGYRPVAFELKCRFSDVPQWQPEWAGPDPKKFPLIDAMPLIKEGVLEIVLINRHHSETTDVTVALTSGSFQKTIRVLELSGPSFLAMNDSLSPGRVTPRTQKINVQKPNKFTFTLKPAALYVLSLTAKNKE